MPPRPPADEPGAHFIRKFKWTVGTVDTKATRTGCCRKQASSRHLGRVRGIGPPGILDTKPGLTGERFAASHERRWSALHRDPALTFTTLAYNSLSVPMPSLTDPARLFSALWPPTEVVAELRARCDLACGNAVARREAAARVHLTLHFLGMVARARLPALRAGLCVPFSPFELRFEGCARWPQGLIVAEPVSLPPVLQALHVALAQVLRARGLGTNEQVFRPHVTLARRHAGPWPRPSPAVDTLRWRVSKYVLAESLPQAIGAYRLLQACCPPQLGLPAPSGSAA